MKRLSGKFKIENPKLFKEKALQWAFSFSPVCVLDNNHFTNHLHQNTDFIIGAGLADQIIPTNHQSLSDLQKLLDANQDWVFACLSYDLKNEIEILPSSNSDFTESPSLFYFVPEMVVELKDEFCIISSLNVSPESVFKTIQSQLITDDENAFTLPVKMQSRTNKETYVKDVTQIKEHILNGDVYELNYCQEFFATDVLVNTKELFKKLQLKNPAPFSAFLNTGNIQICCSSPERFLLRENNFIYSQPIKGTAKRGNTFQEDELYKLELKNSEKELAENLMIVDLVRNDLAKCSKTGTIEVEDLCGVYTYPKVHQLISTVKGKLKEEISFTKIIHNTFPMGSMTGAPKIESMKLIDQYEKTNRGFFSGSIGFIKPNGDFDFNVVIRSIIYNVEKKYLSVHSGGAITSDSVAEEEYEESLLKASALIKLIEE